MHTWVDTQNISQYGVYLARCNTVIIQARRLVPGSAADGASAGMEAYMNRPLHCKNSATFRLRKLSLFEEAPCPQPAKWWHSSYTLNDLLWCARFHVRHTTARPSPVAYQLPGCCSSCSPIIPECNAARPADDLGLGGTCYGDDPGG
jgi:hypothetical protein